LEVIKMAEGEGNGGAVPGVGGEPGAQYRAQAAPSLDDAIVSAEERAKQISALDAAVNKLDKPKKPTTPQETAETIQDIESKYKSVGLDVKNSAMPEFMKSAYVALMNLVKDHEKRIKEGKKGLEIVKDQLEQIAQQINDGLYGPNYKPTNKTPGGLHGDYNVAISQRIATDHAMSEVEKLLGELNADMAKCQKVLIDTPSSEADKIMDITNKQTGITYTMDQLEYRMIGLERKFAEYDAQVTATSKAIKNAIVLYRQVHGHMQTINQNLIRYAENKGLQDITKVMAGVVAELQGAITTYVKLMNEKEGLDVEMETVLAEGAMRPVEVPVTEPPAGESAYDITMKAAERKSDAITKRREEVRRNPMLGSAIYKPTTK
jgi:hypothetical protein